MSKAEVPERRVLAGPPKILYGAVLKFERLGVSRGYEPPGASGTFSGARVSAEIKIGRDPST